MHPDLTSTSTTVSEDPAPPHDKLIVGIVDMGPFDSISYVVGPREQAAKYIAWAMGIPSFAEDMGEEGKLGMTFRAPSVQTHIWLPRAPRAPREYGTLAHECLHAVKTIMMHWTSAPMGDDSEECWCHSMSYLVTKILEGCGPTRSTRVQGRNLTLHGNRGGE